MGLPADFTLPVASAAEPLSPKYLRANLLQTHNSNNSRKLGWDFSEIICILSQLIVTRDHGETKGLKWHHPPKDTLLSRRSP